MNDAGPQVSPNRRHDSTLASCGHHEIARCFASVFHRAFSFKDGHWEIPAQWRRVIVPGS